MKHFNNTPRPPAKGNSKSAKDVNKNKKEEISDKSLSEIFEDSADENYTQKTEQAKTENGKENGERQLIDIKLNLDHESSHLMKREALDEESDEDDLFVN